jgi:hypothetical protein
MKGFSEWGVGPIGAALVLGIAAMGFAPSVQAEDALGSQSSFEEQSTLGQESTLGSREWRSGQPSSRSSDFRPSELGDRSDLGHRYPGQRRLLKPRYLGNRPHHSPVIIVNPSVPTVILVPPTQPVIVNAPQSPYGSYFYPSSPCSTAIIGSPIPSPISLHRVTGHACR